MDFDLGRIKEYRVYCGYADMRFGIDSLIGILPRPIEGLNDETLFLFCGRRADRCKALYWDGYDFLLINKRLSEGRFHWPRRPSNTIKIMAPEEFYEIVDRRKMDNVVAYCSTVTYDLF